MAAVGVLVLLAAVEVVHPTWVGGGVAQAVVAAGAGWIPLHGLLLAGYTTLVWLLVSDLRQPTDDVRQPTSTPVPPTDNVRQPTSTPVPLTDDVRQATDGRRTSQSGASTATATRLVVLAFGACNVVFLTVDGLGVGLLAGSDPVAADALWNGAGVAALANVTGGLWSAALLGLAAVSAARSGVKLSVKHARALTVGMTVTWLSFVSSAIVPAAGAASRAAALATGGWSVFTAGARQIPFALLVFAAVLRQHAGPEASLGLLCAALALFVQARATHARPTG
jgi:hypothetical protein